MAMTVPRRFEAAALMAASTKMNEFIDVYHALYRGVVEVRQTPGVHTPVGGL